MAAYSHRARTQDWPRHSDSTSHFNEFSGGLQAAGTFAPPRSLSVFLRQSKIEAYCFRESRVANNTLRGIAG